MQMKFVFFIYVSMWLYVNLDFATLTSLRISCLNCTRIYIVSFIPHLNCSTQSVDLVNPLYSRSPTMWSHSYALQNGKAVLIFLIESLFMLMDLLGDVKQDGSQSASSNGK